MASPGQRKGACGHIMASFDQHSRCARCRVKGHGDDACVKKLPCKFCELLTPEQVVQLATPTYKLRKDKKLEPESLVDPSSVTVLSSVDQDKAVGVSSSAIKPLEDLSLPPPSFKQDLKDLDDKWSLRMFLHLKPPLCCQQFLLARPVRPPVRIKLRLQLLFPLWQRFLPWKTFTRNRM